MTKKSSEKFKCIANGKSFPFFIIFKTLSLSKQNNFFGKWESSFIKCAVSRVKVLWKILKYQLIDCCFDSIRSRFTWEAKWTQTGMRFDFGWKSQSDLYLCSHELGRNETQNGMDFISVILTEMKSQTGMRFSCEHNLPKTKWISVDSLGVAFNAHAFETQRRYGFHISLFDRNEISCRVIIM